MRRTGLLFLLFVVAASAEDLPRLSEVLEVSVVNLDVIVTDRHGERVHDLTIDGKVNRIAVGVYDEVGHEYGVARVDITPQEPQ